MIFKAFGRRFLYNAAKYSIMAIILKGKAASYGTASGLLKKVYDEDSARKVRFGDIVFSNSLTPRIASVARNANGFILQTIESDHSVGYMREIWKPAVLVDSIDGLKEGKEVTINGFSGEIYEGNVSPEEHNFRDFTGKIKTKLYLEHGISRVTNEAAKLNSAGVGLCRLNLIIQEAGKHPEYFFRHNKEEELQKLLADPIHEIVKAFHPRPVWIRTMDIDSFMLSKFDGGKYEEVEANPMLGLRGLSRDLKYSHILRTQYNAVKYVVEKGFDNVGILYPLVRDVSEYIEAKRIMGQCGLIPHKDIAVGTVFETPSACLQIREFIGEGLDFAFFGINDMTQYAMAVDRTNPNINHLYNPVNTGVLHLLFFFLKECQKNNVETTMTFLTPLKPILGKLILSGLTSLTIQSDRLNEIGTLLENIEKDAL